MKTDNKLSPPKKGRGPLRVDYVPIAKVKPSEKNSRKHDPNQIDKIVASIEAVGWTKPIIVDEDYEILAGHGAYQAAQQLGMAEVPVILRAGLTAAQRRACRNSTKEGDIVLDFFGGSCSTVMAAEQTKRIGYAIELDPHYVDASVRRWQDMTGKQATHGNEKKTFEAVAKARGKA